MLQSILTIINPHDLTTKPYIYIIQDFFLLLMYDFEKKSVFPFFIVHFKVQQLYRPHCQPIACLNHVVPYFVN